MTHKIGLLGGTFDPVHNAHLKIATSALQQLDLNEVQFIPCNIPVHRNTPGATAKQRLKMVELAVANQAKFQVNAIELERVGPSYSIDTVLALQRPNQSLYFILGADAYLSFATWHRWEEITEHCTLVVYPRPGYTLPKPMNNARVLNMPPCEISATRLRQAIAEKKEVSNQLPEKVLQFIQAKKLYSI